MERRRIKRIFRDFLIKIGDHIMKIIQPYTEKEMYEVLVSLGSATLDLLYSYIDTTEVVTQEVIERQMDTFNDHFLPGLFLSQLDYVISIIGRQMTTPVDDGLIFAPTAENYKDGYSLITGPQRYTILITYLLPLAMYGTLYYSLFPVYVNPQKNPQKIFKYTSYNDFRENQTYINLQARYMMIRDIYSSEILGFSNEKSELTDNDNPENKISFYKFEETQQQEESE